MIWTFHSMEPLTKGDIGIGKKIRLCLVNGDERLSYRGHFYLSDTTVVRMVDGLEMKGTRRDVLHVELTPDVPWNDDTEQGTCEGFEVRSDGEALYLRKSGKQYTLFKLPPQPLRRLTIKEFPIGTTIRAQWGKEDVLLERRGKVAVRVTRADGTVDAMELAHEIDQCLHSYCKTCGNMDSGKVDPFDYMEPCTRVMVSGVFALVPRE